MSVLHPDPPAFSSAGLVRKWSSRFAALAGLPMPMPSPAPLLFSAAEPGARAQATRSQSQPSPAQLQSASEQAPSESSVAELASQMGADAVAGPASSEQQNTCRKRVNIAVNENPLIKFMFESLKKAGCPIDKTRIVCVDCDEKRTGGYSPELGLILLCQNSPLPASDLPTTLAHELIHAFDNCTVQMNSSCLHMACTEIRASSLSGECGMFREFRRGNLNLTKGHQKCVRRRAVLSLQMNEKCRAEAERWVDEAFDACFADTAPFQEIYPP